MHHADPAAVAERDAAGGILPVAVGSWRRDGPPRRIEPTEVFAYMDGAGELYLAYRLRHLDVVDYREPERGDITVELYWVARPDDAFGLLSGDWGGEPVALAPEPDDRGWPRALVGAGLLRLWSGDLYARVMASQDDAASRAAVLALGRAIVAGRKASPPPALVEALPDHVAGGFALRRDSVCLLRSHLVLNSAYFLSQQNILGLGPDVTAVVARYDAVPAVTGSGRVQLLVVAYPDATRAVRALDRFRRAYLPEATRGAKAGRAARVEDGWLAYQATGRCVALAFGSPTDEVAKAFAAAGVAALGGVEVCHE